VVGLQLTTHTQVYSSRTLSVHYTSWSSVHQSLEGKWSSWGEWIGGFYPVNGIASQRKIVARLSN